MYEQFEKINVYSFDINQYNRNVYSFYVIVFANYEGKSYFSDDIQISTDSCRWNGYKWELPDHLGAIKSYGLIDIDRNLNNEERML